MKELTIEEKAKAYDEASKWMEGIYPTLTHEQQMEAEAFFPELKESEDEKIRKSIIEHFTKLQEQTKEQGYNCDFSNTIAWLEKQGEKNPTDEEMKTILRTEYEKGKADAIAETQKEWSEDDEKRLQSCINILKAKSLMGKVDTANTMWLKSLKQRIGG